MPSQLRVIHLSCRHTKLGPPPGFQWVIECKVVGELRNGEVVEGIVHISFYSPSFSGLQLR